jgi:hypothetical protein
MTSRKALYYRSITVDKLGIKEKESSLNCFAEAENVAEELKGIHYHALIKFWQN